MAQMLNYRCVNLGGWLVTEGWIKPSLFDGIPNNDLLDGTHIQLQSVKLGTYVVAEDGGGQKIAVNRSKPSGWETFRIWRVRDGSYNLRVFKKQFIGANNGGGGVMDAVANTPGSWETFDIMRNPTNSNLVHIRALNGMYVQAQTEDQLTADFQGKPRWDDNNAATFLMKIDECIRGEFQLTNGYGSGRDSQGLNDGTQIQLRSVKLGTYVTAENGDGEKIAVSRSSPSGWETFRILRVEDGSYSLKAFNNQFIGVESGGGGVVKAVASTPNTWETFQIIRNTANPNLVHIKALNGMYLQAKIQDQLTADFQGEPEWDDNSPATFELTIIGRLQGFEGACQVLNEHRNSFVTEDDFKFLSNHGINAVRIPVGWWIASDPNPPPPFVGGSLDALDNAFTWAKNHGMGVIVTLHAAPGSQNGEEHSGPRDGYIEWADSQENIDTSLAVVDFLAARYGAHPALLGIEPLNEPRAPDVSAETLRTYYKQSYDIIRKHSSTAYVVMCNRSGPADPKEFFEINEGLSRTVIDVHYYSLFSDVFKRMSVQENIDYIYGERAATLRSLVTENGPLILVGEWVAEWEVKDASKSDYQRFAKAQVEVYGGASFGWSYWTLKNASAKHWDFQWMVQNEYLPLPL